MPTPAITGFGVYLPQFRIRTAEIAKHWGQDPSSITSSLGVREKTVAGSDEDSFTMAFEAGKQAIAMAGIRSSEVSAVFAGSESHVYAVKPTSGMLAAALELDPFCYCADLEFACKAGTAAMQIIASMVKSGEVSYGLAVGTDRAQARPGDALEYTASAGAAAFVIGPEHAKGALCRIERTLSFTTDTPDFWRASDERYPRHAGRFTGEPGYFRHVREVIQGMLELTKLKPRDITHLVLHMPNAKFPQKVARDLGFTEEQLELGLVVREIGNTYSACSLIGLARVLEEANRGDVILLASYGSGAGADALLCTMLKQGVRLPPDERPVEYLSYSTYATMNA